MSPCITKLKPKTNYELMLHKFIYRSKQQTDPLQRKAILMINVSNITETQQKINHQ